MDAHAVYVKLNEQDAYGFQASSTSNSFLRQPSSSKAAGEHHRPAIDTRVRVDI